ncbi:MAG TPA: hypothetical protein VF971_04960 [Candidatus Limnocylindrales bacterium]
MRRNLRALALTAVAGLLLLAPVSTAFAISPSQSLSELKPDGVQATPWSLVFRETMVRRMTDRLAYLPAGTPEDTAPGAPFGSRYYGKPLPN